MKTLIKVLLAAGIVSMVLDGVFVYNFIQKKKSENCNPSDMEVFRAFYSNETSVKNDLTGVYIVLDRKEIRADGTTYYTYVRGREHFAEILKNCSNK